MGSRKKQNWGKRKKVYFMTLFAESTHFIEIFNAANWGSFFTSRTIMCSNFEYEVTPPGATVSYKRPTSDHFRDLDFQHVNALRTGVDLSLLPIDQGGMALREENV